jgi:N-acyl amino acid synthase of PEP-CTERM/exosortase system
MSNELRALFNLYFDIRSDVGSEPDLLAEALRLRYQVYCVEHAYEDPDAFPDGMERDVYDGRSLHSLLIHRSSSLVAGTVRLIRPDPSHPIGSLPIETLCKEPVLFDESVLPRATLAEVSRFAVSKGFRRRIDDAQTPTGVGAGWREHPPTEQRRLPHLSVGLVQAMVCNSFRHGITHWVAEMEPALLRMYRKLGVHWIKLGPLVEFHGKRQPCYTQLDEMLARAYRERPDIWDVITDGGEYAPTDGVWKSGYRDAVAVARCNRD